MRDRCCQPQARRGCFGNPVSPALRRPSWIEAEQPSGPHRGLALPPRRGIIEFAAQWHTSAVANSAYRIQHLASHRMATIPEALAIAIQHHQAGRLAEAEQIYRQILAVEPNQADAWHLLGVIAHQVGQHSVAVEYMERTIELKGSEAAFHNNLGGVYRALHRLPEAVACYRRALELKPGYAVTHYNLGVVLKDLGKLEEAIACYRRAVELKPDLAEAHHNLGTALQRQGKLDEAVAYYSRALELRPGYAEAHHSLGAALQRQGKLEEAVACYRQALELKPDNLEIYNNVGSALQQQGKLDEAVTSFCRALELRPKYAQTPSSLPATPQDGGGATPAALAPVKRKRPVPRFVFRADKPLALDSPDHIFPWGTKECNFRNRLFNRKMEALLGPRPLRILDLGCAGGGFVKSCLDSGHAAIGVEGSDYSQRIQRAEWATIPQNLCTGDITAPFTVDEVDDLSGVRSPARFDVVTAWEVIEHIRTADLPAVCRNVAAHLAEDGVWIMSISPIQDIKGGYALHQTVQPRDWWLKFFSSQGFTNHPWLVDYFGRDWVRGPLQMAPSSFHVVLTRSQQRVPQPPPDFAFQINDLVAAVQELPQQGLPGYALYICEKY